MVAGGFAGRRPDRDPVADGRQAVGLVAQPAGMLRLQLPGLGKDAIDVVEFDGDAAGHQLVGGEGRKRLRPVVIPSKVFQIKRHSRLG